MLVVVLDEGGAIRQTPLGELGGREQLELDQSISLSLADTDSPRLAQSRSVSDLGTSSQIDQVRRKARPPLLARPGSADPRPRPAVASLAAPPEEDCPPPPDSEPTMIQRLQAHARIAAWPVLSPPAGSGWANSPLAQPKPPPPPVPMPVEFRNIPPIERWYFFPTAAHGPLIRRWTAAPRCSEAPECDSDSPDGDDVASAQSTAPATSGEDWD